MPQPQDHAKEQELHRVIAAVDQPELEGALSKLVVDAEARSDEAKADQGPGLQRALQRRRGTEPGCEGRSGQQGEQEADAEDLGRMPGRLLPAVLGVPGPAEQDRRVPESTEKEAGDSGEQNGPEVQVISLSPVDWIVFLKRRPILVQAEIAGRALPRIVAPFLPGTLRICMGAGLACPIVLLATRSAQVLDKTTGTMSQSMCANTTGHRRPLRM